MLRTISRHCTHHLRTPTLSHLTFHTPVLRHVLPPRPRCSPFAVALLSQRWSSTKVTGKRKQVHPTSHETQEDDIRLLFDSPTSLRATSGPNYGLFHNRYLTTPDGFSTFAQLTIARCKVIVSRVKAASNTEAYKRIIVDMDRLSDLLCRVLDLCDFVRMAHPDSQFQNGANTAWCEVYQYMNELNTEPMLNMQLQMAMKNPEVTKDWTDEELMTAEILKMDFIKSAITLPQDTRDRVVDLSQEINETGTRFHEFMAPNEHSILVERELLAPMSKNAWVRSGFMSNQVRVGHSHLAEVLRVVHDEDTRRRAYMTTRTASKDSVENLDRLIELRAKLAETAGFETYGKMALRDRMMAKTPENVWEFLKTMRDRNQTRVRKEIDLLNRKKRSSDHNNKLLKWSDGLGKELDQEDLWELKPWDVDYFKNLVQQDHETSPSGPTERERHFPIGLIMQGISRLFNRLFGVRLVPRETNPGETWDPTVRRLNVVSDTDGHIAVLYCDLFSQTAKHPNPAHFTVRCSRAILQPELDEWSNGSAVRDVDDPSAIPSFETIEQAANDGMATSSKTGTLKQLPTVVLMCGFTSASSSFLRASPSRNLTLNEVETLFHEMGHAIHSILARTNLQNVAGTRCATDFAELPSTLFESFCTDPSVLELFDLNSASDGGHAKALQIIDNYRQRTDLFSGIELERQIALALLDQRLYALTTEEMGTYAWRFTSSGIFQEIQDRNCRTPTDANGTSWQGFFGHLFGYGATYYSYLFDRVLARRVWDVVFRGGKDGGAVSRKNGERLKEGILKWGGSRDPWVMLAETLKDESLVDGDREAMQTVGEWSINKKNQYGR